MFKYVGDILKQFTSTQRLIALLILLISITIIMVGPKLVESFKTDKKDYEQLVVSLRNRNTTLTTENEDLSNQILINRRECRIKLVEKENEIIEVLSKIENNLNRNRHLQKVTTDTFVVNDSITKISSVRVLEPTNNDAVNMIRNLKNNLKEHDDK